MALTDTLLSEIITNITDNLEENELLEESFIKKVLLRLDSLGYTPTTTDSWMIIFCIRIVKKHIQNSCNISEIPSGLEEIAIERICGEFLFAKKQSGGLDETFDLDTAIKQVQAGDTNVTFANESDSESDSTRLNDLIAYLRTIGESDLVCYRQMKW